MASVKRYQARSWEEALQAMKSDLGDSAVVLMTRSLRKGGILGVGAREVIEIVATNDVAVIRNFARAGAPAPRATPAFGYRAPGSAPDKSTDEDAVIAVDGSQRLAQLAERYQMLMNGQATPALDLTRVIRDRVEVSAQAASPAPLSPRRIHEVVDDESAPRRAREPERGAAPAASEAAVSVEPGASPSLGAGNDTPGTVETRPPDCESPGEEVPAPCRVRAFVQEVQKLHHEVREVVHHGRDPALDGLEAPLIAVVKSLIAQDVSPHRARGFARRLQFALGKDGCGNPETVFAKLVELAASYVRVTGGIRLGSSVTIAAFVGPTGTGKTTLIRRLVESYHREDPPGLGLLSLCGNEDGPGTALSRLARRWNLPHEVAGHRPALELSLERLAHCDLLLVDTPGVSPRDEAALEELQALLEVVGADETHLVLAASTHPRVQDAAVTRFGVLGVERLALSKLDEAESFGALLDLLADRSKGVSYISEGRGDGGAVEVAQSLAVATRLLAGLRAQRAAPRAVMASKSR